MTPQSQVSQTTPTKPRVHRPESVRPAPFPDHEPGLDVPWPTALPFELFRVQLFETGVGVHILGPLVRPDSDNPREAQGEPARVMRTPLDLIVRDLDDDLGTDMETPPFFRSREPAEVFRHRLELGVRQALECLPDHLEAVRRLVPHREPIIRQPSFAAATSPFRGDDRHVQEVRGLDLEPLLPALAHGIGRAECLRHEALVARDEGGLEERLALFLARRDAAGRPILPPPRPPEGLPPGTTGAANQPTLTTWS